MIYTTLGYTLASGGSITPEQVFAISEQIQVERINPTFLPGKDTILGKVSERKEAIFRVAQNLWGLSAKDWLQMEADWLQEGRNKIGSTETEGKDNTDDVISAELLVRIVATSSVVIQDQIPLVIIHESVSALNQTLADAISKGRTRMRKYPIDGQNWISVYSYLRNSGVMVGTGGGKFLPYPEKSLPILLSMLSRDKINPQAYL